MEVKEMIISSVKELWKREEGKPKPNFLKKDVLYIQEKGSDFVLCQGHENVETNWTYEGSIGYHLGARLKLVHLSLTYDFSEDELSQFLGKGIDFKGEPWVSNRRGIMRIIPSPLIPVKVMDILWTKVKDKLGLSDEDLMPPHPTWVYEDKLGVNFCVRKLGTPKFKDILGDRKDIFYRAGKDLWKTPLKERENIRVLVIKSVPGHDDGVMWTKSTKPFMSLVRAFGKFGDKPLLLKGRLISTELPAGSKEWPEGDYDIVTSGHNIKWGEVPHGTILNMRVQFVSNELHKKQEDEEETSEKRKLTILTLLVSKIETKYRKWVEDSFLKNSRKVARKIKLFSKLEMEKLIKLFQDDPKSMIALDQALKVRMGFIQNPMMLQDIRRNMMNSLRSSKIPGKWLAAIARKFVPAGTIWMSENDIPGFLKEEATVIRYPVTGYQSFLTMKIEARKDIPKGLAMINGDDAKYLALDGDDHILVTKPFSAFRGGEPVLSERTSAEKLDVNRLSAMGLYASGANAQQMIGFCFNAMAKCLGKASASPEAEHYLSVAERLGMLLDMLAQSIKKPYVLDIEAIKIASDVKLYVEDNPIASICLKDKLEEASVLAWGTEIRKIKAEDVWAEAIVEIPADVQAILNSMKKAVKTASMHRTYVVYKQTTYKLKNWVKKHPDSESALKVYYTVAVQMKDDELFTGLMDGTLLLAGRRLLELK